MIMMNLRNTFNEDSFEYTTMNDIMAEGMRQPKRQALYKNLWYENEMCILFGASNCGKSIYAMQIAKHIAQEQPILYFDYELNTQQICDRYTNDEGTSPCKFPQNIFRPNLDFDMAKNFKERRAYLRMRIEEAVTKKGIKLFIIDNITCLHPNLSKASEAATFILELRTFMNSLGASFLILGHSPKKRDNSPITLDNLSGSKNVANFIDSCFCVGEGTTEGNEKRYIKQLKNRSSQIIFNEEHVLVCSIEKGEDNFLYFKEEGYAKEKDLIKGTGNITPEKEKAYQLYKEHKSYRKVAKMTGISDKTIKKWVDEYEEYYTEQKAINKQANGSNEIESAEMRNAECNYSANRIQSGWSATILE
jgi:transposase-like protein